MGDRIFVLGGRAREMSDMSRDRTVGGVLSPRVETGPFYSTWREPSFLKNDVWASDDEGSTWFLVNPGCHAPQAEDVLAGNADAGKYGASSNECSTDSDCYGSGLCEDVGGTGYTTCVCPMWSPRELHAATVHEGSIYVVGGFVSVRKSNCGDHACGDVDAGAHRGYKSDVWYSSDGGVTWDAATLDADWPGRGDHGMFVYSNTMYVVGGAADAGDGQAMYMNDIWRAGLPGRLVKKNFTLAAYVRTSSPEKKKTQLSIILLVTQVNKIMSFTHPYPTIRIVYILVYTSYPVFVSTKGILFQLYKYHRVPGINICY